MHEDFFSPWVRSLEKSDIQKALHTTSNPDIISFSLGRPDNELLEIKGLKDVSNDLFAQKNLQYSPPCIEIKNIIVELMKERGVSCTSEEVFLTTGAQQAMTLLAKLFAHEGDRIIVEQLTYPGFIQVTQALRTTLVPAPVCFQTGLNIGELKCILEHSKGSRFMYTIPEGHNPLGTSLNVEQRMEFIKIAKNHNVPLIEDDAYGFLNYDSVMPALKSYWPEGVFYIGSFSKIFAPSLRIGWIVASQATIEKLEIFKESLDINTSTLSQKIMKSLFEGINWHEHISNLKEQYKNKRDAMVTALNVHIPEMEFKIPKSGFFIWGKLPSSIDTNRLFKLALEEKVSFLPGSAFLVGSRENVQNCLRLSFAFCPVEDIEAGIKRLALAIHKYK